MREEKMIKTEIYEAAQNVTPDVKQQIKADPRFRLPEKRNPFIAFPSLRVATTFFVVAIGVILLLTNLAIPTHTYSTIYVEINPIIEMDFDKNDTLIEVRSSYSGEMLEARMRSHIGVTYVESLDLLIDYAIDEQLLHEDNPVIMIDVDSEDEDKRNAMETMIASRVPDFVANRIQGGYMIRGNQRDASDVELDRAEAMQVGVMRYRLIQTLSEKTGKAPETYADMPVHRIREKLEANDIPVDIPSMTDRPGGPSHDDDDENDDEHSQGPPGETPPGGRMP